ncbi:MAG TPA: SRPBCC domain-containing protein [Candidatus Xenobia bacterium]|jgi:uncharacterized protein YndB with AHSA1/START domain
MEKVFETFVRTTPERVWESITREDLHRQYNFGVGIKSDWQPGSRIESSSIMPVWEGEVLEAEPPRRLVHTYHVLWIDPARDQETFQVTWEIRPVGEHCWVKVTHGGLGQGADPRLYRGWSVLLGGIKQLLEAQPA